jgi:hypothetical protein
LTIAVDIPPDVYNKALEIAESQNISVSDVLITACAEHVSAWERMNARAQRGDRAKFLQVLADVPDVEPENYDRLDRD